MPGGDRGPTSATVKHAELATNVHLRTFDRRSPRRGMLERLMTPAERQMREAEQQWQTAAALTLSAVLLPVAAALD